MGLILTGLLSRLWALARLVPAWIWVLALVLAWGGWQRHQAHAAAAELAQLQAAAAAAREKALVAAAEETARRLQAQKEITDDADRQLVAARSSAAAATAAAARLRARLADHPAGADPAATGPGQADRLAELLGQCADRYSSVAASADRAIIAGRACERAYYSLTDDPR